MRRLFNHLKEQILVILTFQFFGSQLTVMTFDALPVPGKALLRNSRGFGGAALPSFQGPSFRHLPEIENKMSIDFFIFQAFCDWIKNPLTVRETELVKMSMRIENHLKCKYN